MAASVTTVTAPVAGLDAYSSLAGMPENVAIALVNWFPQAYGCYMRRGYEEHATGLGGAVKTLATYTTPTGAQALLAWANGNMFSVTSAGPVGAPLLTGLVNDVWQTTAFANSAGTHLVAFNGVADGIWIHGAAIDRLVAGDGIVNGTWSGVDPKNLIDVTIHQRRIWAVQKDTTYGWYLPPDQVYGVASKFDFGPLFRHGGYLQSLTTWTVDDGDGADDMLIAVSSNGDVAVYRGIDPTSAATWALTGVYFMGSPVSGRRFATKVGGDVKFMTQQGIVSLNEMLTSTKTTQAQVSVESRPVQQPLAEAASALGTLEGWQTYFCPPLNMLMINIPSITTAGNIQFVENVVNSAWCEFQGYDARCFATYQNLPFFGGPNGTVYKGWFGHADNVTLAGSPGSPVVATVQQSYSYFGVPAVNKQVGMYRPNFLVAADAIYGSEIAYDFTFKTPNFGFAAPGSPEARWDSAIWDAAMWVGTLKAQRNWSQAQGMGVAASLCMICQSSAECLWISTDYTYITGGPL